MSRVDDPPRHSRGPADSVAGLAAARIGAGAARVAVGAATVVVVVAVALAPLLAPQVVRALLDRSGSAAYLATTREQVHEWSDLTVAELVSGTGTFAVPGPDGALYGQDEAAHLGDVRVLLRALALAAVACLAVLVAALALARDRSRLLQAVGRGAVAAVALAAVLAAASALAGFDRAFDVFHRIVFPQGNYAFPVDTSVLVRLYPPAFWAQFAVCWGVSLVTVALLVVAVTRLWRRRARAR